MPMQIFGYTPPTVERNDLYVRYMAAHKNDDGSVKFTIRNGAGEHNEIVIPPNELPELYEALKQSN